MSVKTKFTAMPLELKEAIMNEYIAGGISQKELGTKYRFCYRRLRTWFEASNRMAEYLAVANKNISERNSVPIRPEVVRQISGINSISWLGRKVDIKSGVVRTVYVLVPDHPDANKQGYVPEHRVVMEEMIGRRLAKEEIVHHIDIDASNNSPENLILLANAHEHGLLHMYLQLALVALLPKKRTQRAHRVSQRLSRARVRSSQVTQTEEIRYRQKGGEWC